MIILDVKLDNVLCFNDFKANFTFPKKLVNTLIDDEYLEGYPNFKYNRINVITGANASGKTCFGKVIQTLNLFFHDKSETLLTNIFDDKNKLGRIEVDFIDDSNQFIRFKCFYENNECLYDLIIERLEENDSYDTVCSRIKDEQINSLPLSNIIGELYKIKSSWMFNYTDIRYAYYDAFIEANKFKEYINILGIVLKTFDNSILSIEQSKDSKDVIIIKYRNGKVIPIENLRALDSINYLSTGTKYGFNIASAIAGAKYDIWKFFYIDEQCSNVNSSVEKTILSIMISLMNKRQQLFFTTHNLDLLELNLPNHAFLFFSKHDGKIILEKASDYEKRNNVVIRNLYDNDVFGVDPDLSGLDKLMA